MVAWALVGVLVVGLWATLGWAKKPKVENPKPIDRGRCEDIGNLEIGFRSIGKFGIMGAIVIHCFGRFLLWQ